MEVFEQPQCSASHDTTPTPPQHDQPAQLPHPPARTLHNYAALMFFGSIGTLFIAVLGYVWYKDYRLKAKERRRIRAALERIKAKQAANGQGRVPRTVQAKRALEVCTGTVSAALEAVWRRGIDEYVPVSPEMEASAYSATLAEEAKLKRKRTKEKVKRVKPRPTGPAQVAPSKVQKPLTVSNVDAPSATSSTSSLPLTIPTSATAFVTDAGSQSDNSGETVYSIELPKVTEDRPVPSPLTASTPTSLISNDTPKDVDDTPRIPQQSTFMSSSNMSPPASPMNEPVTISILNCPSPSPSFSSCGSLSHGRLSRSASISSITALSTVAPVTPPSRSFSLPFKYDFPETWDSEHASSDSAWDWDGRRSLYTAHNSGHPVQRPVSDPTSPSLGPVTDLPAVVFPSLNVPPPAPIETSPSSQILSLKSTIKMGKQREMKYRRQAEELMKQRDFANWRFQQAQEAFQCREGELQAEVGHLRMQLQGYAIQSQRFIPPPQFPSPGQQFPLFYSHPSSPYLHSSPFSHTYPSPQSSVKNEMGVSDQLAEAILRRPESIRSSTSDSTKYDSHEDISSTSQSQESGEASPIHHESPVSDAIELDSS